MKILRMHLTDFRGVADREVTFGDGVTVVMGPNEVGKSSIAEALQMLLEFKDSSRHRDVKAIEPVGGGNPTAEVELRHGDLHVIFRKCWARSAGARSTTLQVLSPQPESLSGDQAHDRMLALLDERIDMELWRALRIEQQHDLSQAELAKSGVLSAALDAAAGEGAAREGVEDGSLIARLDDEVSRYWTGTGRPRGPLTDDAERHAAAVAAHAEVADRFARVESDVRDRDDAARQLTDWVRGLPELERAATDAAARVTALAETKAAVELATSELRAAEQSEQAAARAVTARSELAQATAAAETAVADAETAAATARARVEALQPAADGATGARDAARTALKAARTTETAALEDVTHVRLAASVAPLRSQLAEAEQLLTRRDEARAVLDAGVVTPATVADLEAREQRARTAQAVLEVGVARMTLRAATATTITIDGVEAALTPGADRTEAVDAERVVEVAGVTINVSPGSSADELRRTLEDATRSLEEALDAAGVETVADARARHDLAASATRTITETDAAWRAVAQRDGVEGIRAELARVQARLEALVAARGDAAPLPATVEEAEQAAGVAAAAVSQASDALELADADVQRTHDALTEANLALASATSDAAARRARHDEDSAKLAAARAESSDEELADALAAMSAAQVTATEARATAAATLDAANADGLTAEAEAAATSLARRREAIQQLRARIAGLEGAIRMVADDGLGEKLETLTSEVAVAADTLAATTRRADALRLLQQTLHRHRDAARSRYVAPLRDRIERYGKVVFDDSFAVTLDESLQVVSRTMHGETLPVDSLSGGAKEQLAILTRMAAASLVDPDDGVPVILDDTLGYADPARTARVNSLIASLGDDLQVIVLTCSPDRFSGIRDADVVALP